MSNLLTKFTSRLTDVIHSVAKNGDHVYTATFEDGGSHVIRRSGRVYTSVAQCWEYQNRGGNTEFLFSAKPTPSLGKAQRSRHIVTVQIHNAALHAAFAQIKENGAGPVVSYKSEVIADNSGKFCSNALRFATREEAEAYVEDLAWRWTAVRETRVVECQDPVNYRFEAGRAVRLEAEGGAL